MKQAWMISVTTTIGIARLLCSKSTRGIEAEREPGGPHAKSRPTGRRAVTCARPRRGAERRKLICIAGARERSQMEEEAMNPETMNESLRGTLADLLGIRFVDTTADRVVAEL